MDYAQEENIQAQEAREPEKEASETTGKRLTDERHRSIIMQMYFVSLQTVTVSKGSGRYLYLNTGKTRPVKQSNASDCVGSKTSHWKANIQLLSTRASLSRLMVHGKHLPGTVDSHLLPVRYCPSFQMC